MAVVSKPVVWLLCNSVSVCKTNLLKGSSWSTVMIFQFPKLFRGLYFSNGACIFKLTEMVFFFPGASHYKPSSGCLAGLFLPDSVELVGNMNNKPPLVFGLQMFIVLPSARGNKQQISQSSRLLIETAAVFQGLTGRLLSFKFLLQSLSTCLTNCFCAR